MQMVRQVDVLITGGAGVVGRSLCRDFLARGKTVRVLTLPGDFSARELPPEVDVFYGDVTRPETLASAFAGANTVCHLAAVILAKRSSDYDRINLGGTRNALAAARAAGVSRFVYISSISVTYPVLTVYGRSKAAGEELVRNSGIPFTILRPTLVVEATGGIEYMIFLRYIQSTPVVFLPGGGKCLKRPVRTADLVRGIASAALSPETVGRTYALAGSRVLSLADMTGIALLRQHKRKPIVNIPLGVCTALAWIKSILVPGSVPPKQALAGFRYDAAPDIGEAKKDFGYTPGTPFGDRAGR